MAGPGKSMWAIAHIHGRRLNGPGAATEEIIMETAYVVMTLLLGQGGDPAHPPKYTSLQECLEHAPKTPGVLCMPLEIRAAPGIPIPTGK